MNNKRISFLGKKVYIGIDVHKKTYSLTAICDGIEVKKWSMAADTLKLTELLHKYFEGSEICTVYEAGFSGFGLHRTLCSHQIKNIVVNPASIEVASNDKKKTDIRDSRKMAEQLSAGRLRGIHIPSEEAELARLLTRTREQIVEQRVSISNQIKSKLLCFGFLAMNDDRKLSETYLKELEDKEMPAELMKSLSYLIEAWRLFTRQIEDFKTELQAQSFEDAEKEEIYRSVPGVGPISARVLANELGDLSQRFANQKSLFQYTGLTPCEYSSGENIHRGHIDRQGSARVRQALVEISWRAILEDKALAEAYQRIAKNRGGKRAIVAIARKLIGRIRACFVYKQFYQLGFAQ